MRGDETAQEIVKELLFGMVFCGVVIQLFLLFFSRRCYNSVGLWLGVLIACGMLLHMKRSIEDTLELGAQKGSRYARKMWGLRYGLVILSFGIIHLSGAGNVFVAFAGVMTLKLAAYLQPVTHRILHKK